MGTDFDPIKDAFNRQKHGLPLDFGAFVLADPHRVVLVDDRLDYGEPRYQVYGMVNGRIYMACFTKRDETDRIISVRKANRREQRRYDQAQGQS